MLLIKKLWLKYKKLFENQQCPWCGATCISHLQKRKYRYAYNNPTNLRKRECPNCHKKIKIKRNPLTYSIMIMCFLISGVIIMFSGSKLSKIYLGILIIFCVCYEEFINVPFAKLVKDT